MTNTRTITAVALGLVTTFAPAASASAPADTDALCGFTVATNPDPEAPDNQQFGEIDGGPIAQNGRMKCTIQVGGNDTHNAIDATSALAEGTNGVTILTPQTITYAAEPLENVYLCDQFTDSDGVVWVWDDTGVPTYDDPARGWVRLGNFPGATCRLAIGASTDDPIFEPTEHVSAGSTGATPECEEVENEDDNSNTCAEATCTPSGATAAADGDEYSRSYALAGGVESENVRSSGGPTQADVVGGMPVKAEAKGKKNWNLDEEHETCSIKPQAHAAAAVRLPPLRKQGDHVVEFPATRIISVACDADDRIQATESFLARLYVGDNGQLVLFDPVRGTGFIIDDLALSFDGTSLEAAAPIVVTGMAPTNVVVELEFVHETRVSGCSATVYI